MLPSTRELTELIGGLYEAAADPTLWQRFLADLTRTFQADLAASVTHHWVSEVGTERAFWNLYPDADRLYRQHYWSIDEWAVRGRWKNSGYAYQSESLCSLEELRTTEIYNDFLVRYDIEHGMFGVVENSVARWVSVSLFRGSASGEFRASDLETLKFLIPHFQRASRVHFQVSELKARSEGIETALNMLAVGAVFLGPTGKVLLMNQAAEKVFNLRDGLFLNRGEISAALQAESLHLRCMTVGATKTGVGRGLSAGGTMLISRAKRRPIFLTIAPLRDFNLNVSQRPAAVLFVSDPDQNLDLPAELLQRCYGLTPAEARLATVLLKGHSLKEAADSCGVTHNTAKSQLKSVFLKTQVRRQSELIRLLVNAGGVVCSRETRSANRTAAR